MEKNRTHARGVLRRVRVTFAVRGCFVEVWVEVEVRGYDMRGME
jgi:hypothetical protein